MIDDDTKQYIISVSFHDRDFFVEAKDEEEARQLGYEQAKELQSAVKEIHVIADED
jgi:hypothetical protein